MVHEPAVLIEGVLFRANYLGSTQIVCEGQPTKYTRMMQAEEAVSRIKVIERRCAARVPATVAGIALSVNARVNRGEGRRTGSAPPRVSAMAVIQSRARYFRSNDLTALRIFHETL